MSPDYQLVWTERHLAEIALKRLTEITGIDAQLREEVPPGDGYADALIQLQVNKKSYRYLAEITKGPIDREAKLTMIKSRLAQHAVEKEKLDGTILIVPYMTKGMAERCNLLGLQFIDTSGNAYIKTDELFVFITGQKPSFDTETTTRTRTGGTAATYKMIFALLCYPNMVNESYRHIAQAAGIALGAVGGILNELERRAIIVTVNSGAGKERKIRDHQKLFGEWAINYPIHLRPKLHPRTYRAPNTDWWKHVQFDGINVWWGGEIAADRMTNYLKPEKTTIYAKPDATSVIRSLIIGQRLIPDPNGDVEILEAFWNFPLPTGYKDIVPPVLVYADLMDTTNARNHEVANLIWTKIFQNVRNTN